MCKVQSKKGTGRGRVARVNRLLREYVFSYYLVIIYYLFIYLFIYFNYRDHSFKQTRTGYQQHGSHIHMTHQHDVRVVIEWKIVDTPPSHPALQSTVYSER